MRDGYTDLPTGKVAAVVTYLEMRNPPDHLDTAGRPEYVIRHVKQPDLNWYRDLYRRVGEPWLWFSRLRMSDRELQNILHDPQVDVFALSRDGLDGGLLEFDRRGFPDIEISYFGVSPALIGQGAGRLLLQYGLSYAWQQHPQRVWLHTCTFDHPGALDFYRKAGFVPYKRAVEIADDPRFTGEMSRDIAPQIPII